jgi:site-specific DNA-methyltransferase (adenine-specific)
VQDILVILLETKIGFMEFEIVGYKKKSEYISDNGIKSIVYLMDCNDFMKQIPDSYFSLSVVDPPYGIGFDGQAKSTSKHGGRREKEFKGWDNEIPKEEYWSELYRVSKNQIVWGANYFTKYLPPSMGWIFWDKGQRICNSDGELAFTSFDRALRVYEINRVHITQNGDTRHPTQKPVKLYDWIFKNYAKPTDKILDTHLGSGSSRIAAYKSGLSFVGIELDKDYFESQEKRFNTFKSQLRLF